MRKSALIAIFFLFCCMVANQTPAVSRTTFRNYTERTKIVAEMADEIIRDGNGLHTGIVGHIYERGEIK